MLRNNKKLFRLLMGAGATAVIAVFMTAAWFYFTLRPTMLGGDVQAVKQGQMKLSAEEFGDDIGINGEIALDVNGEEGEMYPGSSGSLTVWITSNTVDIVSYILTYTSAAPVTDESVFERAKDITNRHILLFKTRTETPVTDSNGDPVTDEHGDQKMDYTYSDPLYPVGEYSENEEVPPYRIIGQLPFDVPQKVTIYWIWPYDYTEYGGCGDIEYLFPPDEEEKPEYNGLSAEERYDEEDSFLGKVVSDMRFRFYVNGNRSIIGL